MNNDVTICIPLYNAKRFIAETMDSALSQSYPYIDYLVIDDGSCDGSLEIVEELRRSHQRGKNIRIIRHANNVGIGETRNHIVRESKTEYIFFLDADDTISKDAISKLHDAAIKFKAQLVYGSHKIIEETSRGKKVELFQYPTMIFSSSDEFANYVYRKYEGIQATMWNVLVEVEVFRRNNLAFLPIRFWEDFLFTMDLPAYVNRVALLSDITYKYHLHSESLNNHRREQIKKEDILETIHAIESVKQNSFRLSEKFYFPKRMFKVMLTDFYVVCNILKNSAKVQPRFTNRELRSVMSSPLTLKEVLSFRVWRIRNLLLYLLGVLPSAVSVFFIRIMAKYKSLL